MGVPVLLIAPDDLVNLLRADHGYVIDAVDASGVDVSGDHVDAVRSFAFVFLDSVGVRGSLQGFPGPGLGSLSTATGEVTI